MARPYRPPAAPSSNSSSREGCFRRFVGDSFAALRAEVPGAYAAMCGNLSGKELRLEVDGEIVALGFDAEAHILDASRLPDVDVATTRAGILDVIDARHSLATAVLADRLYLRGRPADILAFHDALLAYVHGGVRAPSFRGLLRRFRKLVGERENDA